MQNARLDELQARVKNARRNFSNLRYVDDTTLTAESEEELKSLLLKVKEDSEKAGLKLNIQGFPGGSVVKNPPASAGNSGSTPGLGRFHMPQSN